MCAHCIFRGEYSLANYTEVKSVCIPYNMFGIIHHHNCVITTTHSNTYKYNTTYKITIN